MSSTRSINRLCQQGLFEFLYQGIFLSWRGTWKHGHSRRDDQPCNWRILKVGDFVADVKRAALKNALYDGAVKALGGKENLQSEVEVVENFYIAKDGLHFVYTEYEIACYAAGPVEVVIDPKSL